MGERRKPGENINRVRAVADSQQPPLTVEAFLRREYVTKSDTMIAKECGVRQSTISQLRRRYHIPTGTHKVQLSEEARQKRVEQGEQLGKSNTKIAFPNGEDVEEGLLRRIRSGSTAKEIAKEAGVTPDAVNKRLQKMKLPNRRRGRRKKAN